MSAISPHPEGVDLCLHVVPRARADRIEGLHGEAIKVRLRAPPVDGKANAALLRFLAETLDVSPAALTLLAGETGRLKRVRVAGVTAATARARLLAPR